VNISSFSVSGDPADL